MKVLILSDTHLSKWFDKKKFDFLSNIIGQADKVILNGDFWDCWYLEFNRFIETPWRNLFPLLKERDTVYIHGNHDPMNKCNKNTELFSNMAVVYYEEIIDGVKYAFAHGHSFLEGKKKWYLEYYDKFLSTLATIGLGKPLHFILHYFEITLMNLFGVESVTKSKIALGNNQIHKKLPMEEGWLVCGHTHGPEIDFIKKYINGGCIINNTASYLLIENGNPNLIYSKY